MLALHCKYYERTCASVNLSFSVHELFVVQISLLSLGAESMGYGNIGAFRALRTLRALRPLRAVSRWEGMKVKWQLPLIFLSYKDTHRPVVVFLLQEGAICGEVDSNTKLLL